MIKEDISREEIKQKIQEFLVANSEHYSEYEKNFILNNYFWGRKSSFVPDILRQIYDDLNLLDDSKNIYNGFIDILESNFDFDQDIIEVGGGRIISGIAKRIALKQNKGTVTVYDPLLFQTKNDIPNLILKKEEFSRGTNISDAKLIYGFMPYFATKTIIQAATDRKIDFLIALCDGYHERYDDIYSDYSWHDDMMALAERRIIDNGLGSLGVADLKDYNDPFPILYNKRPPKFKKIVYNKNPKK